MSEGELRLYKDLVNAERVDFKLIAKKLFDELQQKENIIKEARKKLIKSKEYQAVKSLGFNSKMSILIELEEMLYKEVN